MFATKRINKEIEDNKSFQDTNCSAGPISEDNVMQWEATIFGPEGTPYHNGVFRLKIDFTEEYPFKPPRIVFTTSIFHCNINERGNICLDILNKNWSPALTINNVLISICSLMASPNPDDPLVPHIAELFKSNRLLHDYNAKQHTLLHAMI